MSVWAMKERSDLSKPSSTKRMSVRERMGKMKTMGNNWREASSLLHEETRVERTRLMTKEIGSD